MSLATDSLSLRTRSERLRGPVLSASAVAVATLALHLRDPHVTHSWGVCPLYAVTGIYCPGCGGLRGVNDLTNGHVGQAASSNLLMVVAIPFAAYFFVRWVYGAWTAREVRAVPHLPQGAWICLAVLAAAFTVARNLPGSWLAP